MKKYTLILSLATMMTINMAYAGNDIENICSQKYHSNKTVEGLNVSTEAHHGFGINVKIDGVWNVMLMQEGSTGFSRDIAYKIAETAFLMEKKVNACYGNGFITGIELIK